MARLTRKLAKAAGYIAAHLQAERSTPLGISLQEMLVWFCVAMLFLFVIGRIPW